ncbi:DMT family transporter [Nonomuraea sp. NPDC050790]|uniref:DMT family transporter n=1 Tax=Nonomuraea sp. NPDC050790 TaxID=3364371 RepID=UPI00379BDD69
MAVVPAPRPLLGAVLLLFVSAAWGSAFPLMKDLIHRLPVEDLLAERYTIAAITLFLLRPGCLRGLSRSTWINAIVLGVMFGAGQTAQAVALESLPSSVSGFAVGCSVIITPLLALVFLKVRVPMRVWAGVALAMAGMTVFTLLSEAENHELSIVALGATLGAATLYSGHTLMLARMSRARQGFDAYAVTVVQLGTIGLLTGLYAVGDGIAVPSTGGDWVILAHLSVVACALGFLARSYGQVHVPAVPSAVLMSSQPLWVAAIAVLWFSEPVGMSLLIGGGLMAGAMLLVVPARGGSSTAGEVAAGEVPATVQPPPSPSNTGLLRVSRRAAKVLADLRVKRDDPLKFDRTALPIVPVKAMACAERESCPWNNRAVKGSGEPSLDRLLQRATAIVRARSAMGPGCCQSVTLLGRCLCTLIEEAEQQKATASSWFRPN